VGIDRLWGSDARPDPANAATRLPNYPITRFLDNDDRQMQLARVIGSVVVNRKDENLTGATLLLVQPLTPEHEPTGRPLVAVDAVGAGVGEEVFFVRGKEASFPFHPAEPPVDAGIVGIVDHWDVER
jgi:microcompartment protein CcmK/EutM